MYHFYGTVHTCMHGNSFGTVQYNSNKKTYTSPCPNHKLQNKVNTMKMCPKAPAYKSLHLWPPTVTNNHYSTSLNAFLVYYCLIQRRLKILWNGKNYNNEILINFIFYDGNLSPTQIFTMIYFLLLFNFNANCRSVG